MVKGCSKCRVIHIQKSFSEDETRKYSLYSQSISCTKTKFDENRVNLPDQKTGFQKLRKEERKIFGNS